LPLEADCVHAIFDKFWNDEGKQYRKAVGDPNTYTTGVIGDHNVVLAHMPHMGVASASGVAASLRSSFPKIKLAVVVGICGGVPYTDENKPVLLGDIVISQAVVLYRFGRQYPEKFQEKDLVEDSLGRPPQEIRAILAQLRTRHYRQAMQANITKYFNDLQQKLPDIKYPGPRTDLLYDSFYLHKHQDPQSGVRCDECRKSDKQICHAALKMTCHELKCGANRLVRNRVSNAYGQRPVVHIGKMGSGDTVMKSGEDRDRIAKADGIIAFEMEGAGLWDHFPSIVIKGVCDYADSHKNKQWQRYAAATAAACLKAFLREWIPEDEQPDQGKLSVFFNDDSIAIILANCFLDKPTQPVRYIPFGRLPMFVGRRNEMEMLEVKLLPPGKCQRAAILGLGGAGKSRMALELVGRTMSQRSSLSVFWVQGTNVLTFENDYLEIGKKLEIPGIQDEKANIKNLMKQRLSLESAGEWIMVLDNADEEEIWGTKSREGEGIALVDYLPVSATGLVLVTTRNRRVANFLAGREVVKLHEMEKGEAVETLRNLLVKPGLLVDVDATLALLNVLTFLPLAIVQAAAYINENDTSIQVYLGLLDDTEENVIDLLSENFGDGLRDPSAKNPVASTWLVSFEQICRHHPLAGEYLSYMSCLNDKNIPQSLLPDAPSKKKMVDAIGTLTGYAFIRRHGDDCVPEPIYDMHRLVHLATRNWLRHQNTLLSWTTTALVQVTKQFPTRDHKNKDEWTLLMPHAQALCSSRSICDLNERYDLVEKIALCLVADGKYDEAVTMHFSVVHWREVKFGGLDKYTLAAYQNLGEALREQGDLTKAEIYAKRAFNGLTETLGAEHPSTLTSMAHLALTYGNQGRWAEAEGLEVQVLETRKRVLGAEYLDTLTSMANLASTYRNQGRWAEAEELEVQVLETRKRVLGVKHPDTLTSMANLASTYRNQGRWAEAEELDVQVLETRKRVLGAEHLDTLASMANLASTYRNQGRWAEAEELEVQVLETEKRVLGTEHPDTLTSMANLASTYRNQGRWAEAEELDVQVLETRKRVLGAEHPDTLTSMGNLASTYSNQGRWAEAEELDVQVLETRTRILGAEHPSTLINMANLASTYRNQGRWAEAEELDVQVLETRKRVLGAEHPDTLTSMGNLASTYRNQGRWAEAEELNVQVLETRKRVLGAEHPDTLTSMSNLASTFWN
jgi:nucleoside phosphorylase/tetratricopeptide (TPR) repeat protein